MKYCKKCVLPNSRPGLIFDKFCICNACKNNFKKVEVNWDKREKDFLKIVQSIKKLNRRYDCLIPVSGGKDSHWQVITALKYGLNPLTITFRPPLWNRLGQDNLDNLRLLGVDHFLVSPNPKVEKLFIKKSLIKYGTTAIPIHMGMFQSSFQLAVKYEIPLIIWGENTAFEYGSDYSKLYGSKLNQEWFKVHGNTHGTFANDWIDSDLSKSDLAPYTGPSDNDMLTHNINGIFLGHYFNWDPDNNKRLAVKNGFKYKLGKTRTGHFDYADLDDDFISIHHYVKYHKFGFSRIQDNLSIEIRNGRLNRKEAIKIIKSKGYDEPSSDIKKLCNYLGIKTNEFKSIIESFRNKNIWVHREKEWVLKYPLT
jgi:N-acetyl sugar amidotransferase